MIKANFYKSKWGDCPVCGRLLCLEDKLDVDSKGNIQPHYDRIHNQRCDGIGRKPDTHRYN
jgi:hypothetical protein